MARHWVKGGGTEFGREADSASSAAISSTSADSMPPGTLRTFVGRHRDLLLALLVNLACPLLLFALFPASEKTDDYITKLFLSGANSGEVSARLPYSNILLGYVLACFQRLLPHVAWYEVAQYATLYASFTAFTYRMARAKTPALARVVTATVLAYFGFECYVKLTFTKTAGIAICVGFFLVLYALRQARERRATLCLGIGLALVGAMFRFKMLTGVMPLFLVLAICLTWQGKLPVLAVGGSRIARVPVALLALALILGASLGFKEVGRYLFALDDQWAAYREYNDAKVPLQDYGWPDYYEKSEEFESMGISANDYQLWTDRDYGDTSLLSTERLIEIGEMKGGVPLLSYVTSVGSYLGRYPSKFLDAKVVGAVLTFLFLLALCHDRAQMGLALLVGLVFFAEYYYLYVQGRYGTNHVDTVLLLAYALCCAYLLLDATIDANKLRLGIMVGGVLLAVAACENYEYMMSPTYTGDETTVSTEDARTILRELTADDDSLYVLSNDENYGILRAYDVLESPAPGSQDNIFVLSTYMYPPAKKMLSRWEVDNIYAHMCDDNVYYVTSAPPGNVNLIVGYLREHYVPDAAYVLDHYVGPAAVYKFHDHPIETTETNEEGAI